MKGEHTPGPWEVHSIFAGPLEVRAGDRTVAMVAHEHFDTCSANAELIAAAPDLLAALESFIAIDDGDEPLMWNFTKELSAMRAAIAKAKR